MYKEIAHNENELLFLVAKADPRAWRQLFDLYWDQVYGTALRLSKSPELAKDLAQDVFLKLWNHRTQLLSVKNFRGYLVTVTKNLAHDHLRTRVFHDSNKAALARYFAQHVHSPEEQLEQKELGGVLGEAIHQLPPQLLQVFTLGRLEGLSHEEIGKRLKISPLSSKTYMTRALLALRKQLVRNGEALLIACLLIWRFFF